MQCRCGVEFCYNCGGTECPHGNCKLNLPLSILRNIEKKGKKGKKGKKKE